MLIETARHAYVGFVYAMVKTERGWSATPLSGQHPAAGKERHKRAAIETFIAEKEK